MPGDTVDFDLSGIASVRLIDASESDVAAVGRQLGFAPGKLNRPPDITLRFVETIQSHQPLRFLGVGDVGYTDNEFLLLRGAHKTTTRVVVPVEQLGEPCELLCQSGLRAVPLLIAILHLAVLGNGYLPLHASGFDFYGRGVLCMGWSKGGKTETLLGFMSKGAKYLGDEWIYLKDGTMRGIPEPIHVWDWHLEGLPGFRQRLGSTSRRKLWLARSALKTLSALSRWPLGPIREVSRRLLPFATSQCHAKVSPAALFGDQAFRETSSVDQIVFVVSHDSAEYIVEEMEAVEAADRMVHSLQYERSDLMLLYEKFRFAFPERRNVHIENLEALHSSRLLDFFRGRSAHVVYHPYPAEPLKMFDVLEPVLASKAVQPC